MFFLISARGRFSCFNSGSMYPAEKFIPTQQAIFLFWADRGILFFQTGRRAYIVKMTLGECGVIFGIEVQGCDQCQGLQKAWQGVRSGI
jgi:hypothetical protein